MSQIFIVKMSSHEEKMFNLQCQMRQNQSELQDFLKELDSWETDMKQKEQQLLTSDKEENDAVSINYRHKCDFSCVIINEKPATFR